MISKSEIKFVQSFKLKKYRQKYNLFVAEGDRTVRSMLDHRLISLHRLYASSEWLAANKLGINPSSQIISTSSEMKKISFLSTPTPVLALFTIPDSGVNSIQHITKAIYLDDIQDPGNMGTIIRIADWYGVETVVRSSGSADFYNPKVVQSAMGSIGHMPLLTLDKRDFPAHFKDFVKIGASLRDERKSERLNNTKLCLVIGNEGKGISNDIYSSLDQTLVIPGNKLKSADSLNASVATGILCQHIFGATIK